MNRAKTLFVHIGRQALRAAWAMQSGLPIAMALARRVEPVLRMHPAASHFTACGIPE